MSIVCFEALSLFLYLVLLPVLSNLSSPNTELENADDTFLYAEDRADTLPSLTSSFISIIFLSPFALKLRLFFSAKSTASKSSASSGVIPKTKVTIWSLFLPWKSRFFSLFFSSTFKPLNVSGGRSPTNPPFSA